jgi:hypothetical protein
MYKKKLKTLSFHRTFPIQNQTRNFYYIYPKVRFGTGVTSLISFFIHIVPIYNNSTYCRCFQIIMRRISKIYHNNLNLFNPLTPNDL